MPAAIGVPWDITRFKRELAARGLSTRSFAAESGIDASVLYRAMQGRPSARTVRRIAEALVRIPELPGRGLVAEPGTPVHAAAAGRDAA